MEILSEWVSMPQSVLQYAFEVRPACKVLAKVTRERESRLLQAPNDGLKIDCFKIHDHCFKVCMPIMPIHYIKYSVRPN